MIRPLRRLHRRLLPAFWLLPAVVTLAMLARYRS